jgi:hypothetical protein
MVEKTADWYRENYPGFPEEYYEVFEKFSASTVNEFPELGGEDNIPQQQVQRLCVQSLDEEQV